MHRLAHSGVLRFSFLIDGQFGICVFPKRQKIFIRFSRRRRVVREDLSTSQLQLGKSTSDETCHDAGMIENFSKLGRCQRVPLHGYIAGADLHRLVHAQGHVARLEDQAHLVHGGHRRPVDQSGPGAHDGEARQGQDGRSECQPCGLHVSPEGNGQAHRGGRHLRARQLAASKSLRRK
jgi:hypothetical protein